MLLFFVIAFLLSCEKSETIKFAIVTDVHQDIIHDAPKRITTFVNVAEKENVDFIIQLGDFCFPKDENKLFIDNWNLFKGPKYHVFGNHDMDVSSKAVTQEFWRMKNPFYSFDQGDFHFIVLDPNYYIHEGEFIDYNKGNYYAHSGSRANIPPKQMEWLKDDLNATEKLTIVFSHQSLVSENSVKNQNEVRKIFEQANLKKKKVIACFNGHEHDDDHIQINGVNYIGINSASYQWVGSKYEFSERFDAEINKARPSLKYTLPYAESIFAIVEINTKGVLTIKGRSTSFVPPGPEELGIKNKDGSIPATPMISDRTIKTMN
jgi:predicted phosphodiesterase